MNPEKLQQIRDDALMDLAMEDRHKTKEQMKGWFLKRYEDPANSTPYDSSEGGYIYLWGGPYDAHDILHNQFGDTEDSELIAEAAEELTEICPEWEKIPTLEDISPEHVPETYKSGPPYPVLDIDIDGLCLVKQPNKTSSRFYLKFRSSVSRVFEELNKQDNVEDPFICSLLFGHLITALEVYFQDSFTEAVKEEKTKKRFVCKFEAFTKEKITIADLYEQLGGIDQKIAKELLQIIWHRLDIIQGLFKDILEIKLPHIKPVYEAVLKRHDIVHRGCREKATGKEFSITKDEVGKLGNTLNDFLINIDKEYCEKHPPND